MGKNLGKGTGVFVYLLVIFLWSGAVKAQDAENKAHVARAQFTTEINEREPVDHVVLLGSEAEKVYFFTDLRNLNGQRVKHRWEYNGQVEAEVEFNVASDRWRTFSSKTMDVNKLGEWTVVVVDEQGWPLKAVVFEYVSGPTKLYEQ